jgi:sugar (pentulose or hexulose) kinase
MIGQSAFKERDLSSFENYETAYHQLILDIILQQVQSTKIILNATHVKRIFVDGGFSQNHIYMHLLATAFPAIEIFAANIPQASAFGAALALHDHWNKNLMPDDLINLTLFKATEHISL